MEDKTIDYELESEQALLEENQSPVVLSRCKCGINRGSGIWLLLLPWTLCLMLVIALGISVVTSAAEQRTDGYWRHSEFSK